MAPPPGEVSGGFRRLLQRLDARTRREFCVGALAEEAKLVAAQLRACAAALAQAQQVEDATRQLATRGASRSVRIQLQELAAVDRRAVAGLERLFRAVKGDEEGKSDGKKRRADARTVVHEVEALLGEERGAETAERSVALVRCFVDLMPEEKEADKHRAFWTDKLKDRVVRPVLEKMEEMQACKRLKEQLKAARSRLPYAAPTFRYICGCWS